MLSAGLSKSILAISATVHDLPGKSYAGRLLLDIIDVLRHAALYPAHVH